MYFLVCVLIKITILVEIPSRPGQRELPIGPPIRLRLTHAGFDPPLASPQQDVSSMSPEHIWHWSLPLHHGMSEDRYSAGYQQPSAPLAGASLDAHTVQLRLTVSSHTLTRAGFERPTLASPWQDATTLGRWSGSCSLGVSFLGREHPRTTFQ